MDNGNGGGLGGLTPQQHKLEQMSNPQLPDLLNGTRQHVAETTLDRSVTNDLSYLSAGLNTQIGANSNSNNSNLLNFGQHQPGLLHQQQQQQQDGGAAPLPGMDDWEQTFKFMMQSGGDAKSGTGNKLLDQEELFRMQIQKRNAANAAASMRFPPMQQQPPPMPFGNAAGGSGSGGAGEMSELEYFYLNGGGHLGGLPQQQQQPQQNQGNMSKFFAFHKSQQSQVGTTEREVRVTNRGF